MPLSIILPNVRKLFITDPGYIMYEADLKGADAQVVAWEAEDEDLKAAFRSGRDIHIHNAEAMWGVEFTRLDPRSHAWKAKRQECKHTVHGINYGCSPRTTAIQRGWLVREAERFHTRWLSLHPGISQWHSRIKNQLEKNQTITNAFGFRRRFFDRVDNAFTEALSWIPQSTVALNTYAGALQLEKAFWPHHQEDSFYPETPEGIILQTHDSLNFQFLTPDCPSNDIIRSTLLVKTPYPDPLYIPWDLKSSTKSWGDMQKCE
jgi:DNA polymerase I